MKHAARLALAIGLAMSPGLALAQSDTHHPKTDGGAQTAPQQNAMAGPCAPMMQMMSGMGQMMGGGMGQQMGGNMGQQMMGGDMAQQMTACMNSLPEASKAYMAAMSGMNAQMMEAMVTTDPDVAFVKGMVAHHQAAIGMAKAALQHGRDERVRGWANDIIKAQQGEIDEMQKWLRERGQ